MTDDIMMEVHAIKDAMGAEHGYHFDAFFKEIQRGEAKLKAAGFQIVPPPEHPADLSTTALQRMRFARR
ncbi:MAG: hypothetical protein K9L32_10600 [Chromatiaceae bacterium]|nr:hypothetical protein [Chromatiaceae bacterium]MCF8004635.1 hypothetical protein [Chromatiaceae bacterium]